MHANWRKTSILAALALCTLWPSVAFAHPEHDQLGFSGGLTHPLLGLDHLAAMAAIGLVAARYGRAAWILPVAFISCAAIGALSGLANPSAAVETGVALSVIGIGAWVVFGARLPVVTALAVTGASGFMHGWAHGGELSSQSASLWFLAGALVTTALLHAMGMLTGLGFNALNARQQKLTWAAAGGAVMAAGFVALIG
jgi:urease accessory protein